MILLDESVPDIIQTRLRNFSISTVSQMKWRGVKNGGLLDLMAQRFSILITTDKNLPFQQNLKKRQLSVIVLSFNDVPSVTKLLPQIEEAIQTVSPGEFIKL